MPTLAFGILLFGFVFLPIDSQERIIYVVKKNIIN